MVKLRLDAAGVIGIMSGTSLDGLDLCYVHFNLLDGKWHMSELKTKAIDYSTSWRKMLAEAYYLAPNELSKLDVTFGNYIAHEVAVFIEEEQLANKIDLIASHGHTIFHQPQKGFTVQIGNGQVIADRLKMTVVADFRSKDVSLGGQGAPLVPIGDRFLFGEYEACLNLGGIANVSFEVKEERIAFDIAPCNLPLNKIMREQFSKEYDASGSYAAQGKVINELLSKLNSLSFYQEKAPKSLGVEWMNAHFYPLLNQAKYENAPAKDLLRTIVEHETDQIAQVLNRNNLNSILVTGGGALNTFFLRSLKRKTIGDVILPSKEIIAFKEAMIFAFLGLRCLRNEVNALKSVTGATRDSVGGVISYPSSV